MLIKNKRVAMVFFVCCGVTKVFHLQHPSKFFFSHECPPAHSKVYTRTRILYIMDRYTQLFVAAHLCLYCIYKCSVLHLIHSDRLFARCFWNKEELKDEVYMIVNRNINKINTQPFIDRRGVLVVVCNGISSNCIYIRKNIWT